jgi:hypothetical protein
METCFERTICTRHVRIARSILVTLHVELEAPSDSIVDQYKRAEVPWRVMSLTGNHLRSAAQFSHAAARFGVSWPAGLSFSLLATGFDVFRRYRAYVQAADFRPGSVAVIGYDYLFRVRLHLRCRLADCTRSRAGEC